MATFGEGIPVLMINGVLVAAAMVTLWLISVWRRDASIVDMFWGLGFVLVAWSTWVLSHPELFDLPRGPRSGLLLTLVTLWGLRLSGYLTWRNWRKPEDPRYRAMREHHGEQFPLVSLFTVFGLQGVILWFVALPVQWGIPTESPLTWLDGLGLLLTLTGITFESVGDFQLARFRADPENRGRVLDRGLWRYTRHPNYFGDFLVWWGIYFVAAAGGAATTLFSPLLMSWLLLRVSGVTLLEKSLVSSKPGYADYIRRTSSFFPWPPARSPSAGSNGANETPA
jgi:steroid 5-alpha reductase family enzyme